MKLKESHSSLQFHLRVSVNLNKQETKKEVGVQTVMWVVVPGPWRNVGPALLRDLRLVASGIPPRDFQIHKTSGEGAWGTCIPTKVPTLSFINCRPCCVCGWSGLFTVGNVSRTGVPENDRTRVERTSRTTLPPTGP